MTEDTGTTPGPPDFPALVRQLREAVALFDTLERVRMPYAVPDDLYELCRAVIDHHDHPAEPGPGGGPPPTSRRRAEESALHHAPLRQMIFEVIPPGESFTVSDVTRGLADLGISANPSAVSNVLGYWVTRKRLQRVRKGVYRSLAGTDAQEPADSSDREEPPGNHVHTEKAEVLEKARKAG
jgi:hypothetical protein